MEKMLSTLVIIVAILFIIFIGFFVYSTIEMLNDHYCYTLPIEEYRIDTKCKRYWNEWNR
jgi:uncharacterized protein YxeA